MGVVTSLLSHSCTHLPNLLEETSVYVKLDCLFVSIAIKRYMFIPIIIRLHCVPVNLSLHVHVLYLKFSLESSTYTIMYNVHVYTQHDRQYTL